MNTGQGDAPAGKAVLNSVDLESELKIEEDSSTPKAVLRHHPHHSSRRLQTAKVTNNNNTGEIRVEEKGEKGEVDRD